MVLTVDTMKYANLILFCAMCWSGCSLFSPDKEVVVTSIEEELRLDLWNPLTTPSQFALAFSTLEEECPGTEISTSHSHFGKTISIAIHGLLENTGCTDPNQPAEEFIPASIVPGFYEVVIRLGNDIINTGNVTFDGAVYTLSMHSNYGLMLGHTELHRIPNSIVWGMLSSNLEAIPEFDQLKAALSPLGTEPDLTTGYYGHFSVGDNSTITLAKTSGYSFDYPFLIALESDVDDLETAVEQFRSQIDPAFRLVCYTWDGQEL